MNTLINTNGHSKLKLDKSNASVFVRITTLNPKRSKHVSQKWLLTLFSIPITKGNYNWSRHLTFVQKAKKNLLSFIDRINDIIF